MAPPRKKKVQPETAVDAPAPAVDPASPSDPAAALLEAGAELADAAEPEYESAHALDVEPEPEPDAPSRTIACPLCGGEGSLVQAPRQSERYRRCDECDGFGEVLSGSLVAEAFMLPCESCESRGYRANPDYLAAQALAREGSFMNPSPPNPPAPGMVWDSSIGMWAYPRASAV